MVRNELVLDQLKHRDSIFPKSVLFARIFSSKGGCSYPSLPDHANNDSTRYLFQPILSYNSCHWYGNTSLTKFVLSFIYWRWRCVEWHLKFSFTWDMAIIVWMWVTQCILVWEMNYYYNSIMSYSCLENGSMVMKSEEDEYSNNHVSYLHTDRWWLIND